MENLKQSLVTDTGIMEPGDYLDKEKLVCCGKCHTRRQTRKYVKLIGRDKVFPINCRCRAEKQKREDEERAKREHRALVDRLQDTCFNHNKALRNCTFENAAAAPPKALKLAKDYAEHWPEMYRDNIGYLFWGNVGNGKTYLAACIANAVMEQEGRVLMRNMGYFLNSSFANREVLLKSLCDYDLLILDDFGMERGTEYGLEMVFAVIDARYASKKPTIITTNLSLDALHNPKTQDYRRIYDRVLEMCSPVKFEGESIRANIQKNKMENLREICDIRDQEV